MTEYTRRIEELALRLWKPGMSGADAVKAAMEIVDAIRTLLPRAADSRSEQEIQAAKERADFRVKVAREEQQRNDGDDALIGRRHD